MYLIGHRGSPHVHDYRDFLERNRVAFRWIDVDRNPLVRHLGKLERIALQDSVSGETEELQADALFILIGGEPTSSCAKGWLLRDEHGFLVSGPDVLASQGLDRRWPLDRGSYFLESSQPGVFFAGDVRHGSVKRVASAVGEGAMAAQLVHRYFAETRAP
jgi:thioredoxin reductase (NADPH)